MSGTHTRNTHAMQAAIRCGAKARSGEPCKAPAISGAARCRMHGGKGSGAPPGNRNAQKHGAYAREMKALWLEVRRLQALAKLEVAGRGGQVNVQTAEQFDEDVGLKGQV